MQDDRQLALGENVMPGGLRRWKIEAHDLTAMADEGVASHGRQTAMKSSALSRSLSAAERSAKSLAAIAGVNQS